ncbi:MAG: nucleotidyltransferase domain-containing protein [Clostridia bacterium]|nr:nucleotidyltransferase domain-containing protein [Clostridia bacterium]
MSDKIYSIEEIKEIVVPICKKFFVKQLFLFGSYARKAANNQSDIDLLVDTEQRLDLETYRELEDELADSLEKDVDIVFIKYINPYMYESIVSEAVSLYEYILSKGQKGL